MVEKKRRPEAEAEASGVEPRTELLNGGGSGGGPRDDEPKKRRKGGGDGSEGGGKSGSIIDNAQSYELATRVGYQVVASPSKIQEMEKPMEPYHEVFLSFRGSDTHRDITDYLYHSLVDAGIRAYRDDEELRVGKDIGPELLQAIKQSKISIPIFSKQYAASKWCLMELVQMVECKEKWGQEIMPIFYDVEPSEVRKQTRTYGEAIQSHVNKQLYTNETIQNWKAALNKVGKLKGWELKERGKGEFTKEIVQKLLIELKKNYLAVTNCLVEMDDQVDQIMEKIGEQTTGTKIVGIYGMGGVGKTTLATILYNKLLADFDNCCFLSNIRETKIVSLQNQLISDVLRKECPSIKSINEGITEIKNRLSSKKVLLLLDDVDQNTQLEALVGTGECWFSRGSKVIITTRDKELLKVVDFQHELTEMDFGHSLQLFSRHAFGRDSPPAEYVSLSQKAVEICGHLPLALEIIGSLLHRNDINKWKNVLKKLETIPNEKVKNKLNISFEALETQEQEIFLDVCCFFVGFNVRIVTYMWDSCEFFPECSLEVLKQRSLIKIAKGNQLWVHDQLRDLGRVIVRERAREKQSRVWDHEEAIDVLETEEGRKNVEAIRLMFNHQFQDSIENGKSILSKLRFLQVDCVDSEETNGQHFPSTN
ncbi:TMV resistance protein N isoform X3 [Eucalyptus grandis]|uniref:TMV resistance protein N isoform X3 n=2 Tax=Eucalyptus grandis TaxID=71139 RepID=UPI00192E785C|nr:TMV resistance protein N isoform X3 [Eucalyptus grandis]